MSKEYQDILNQFLENINNLINKIKLMEEKIKIDIVKRDKIEENIKISEEVFDNMTIKEVRAWYLEKYKEILNKQEQIQISSKQTKIILDNLLSVVQQITTNKSMFEAVDRINIDNLKIVCNKIVDELLKYNCKEAEKYRIQTESKTIRSIEEYCSSNNLTQISITPLNGTISNSNSLSTLPHLQNISRQTIGIKQSTPKRKSLKSTKLPYQFEVNEMKYIGRYFQTNNDFINMMKVCKKFKNLVGVYDYNPISDPILFKKMKIQHFYCKEDMKYIKQKIEKCIFWYLDHDVLNFNGTKELKDIYSRYISKSSYELYNWVGFKHFITIYDSDIDGPNSEMFRNRVLGNSNLYFIAIDNKLNIFGHYHSTEINSVGTKIYDNNIFIFTLNSNGRCGKIKFNLKKSHKPFTLIDKSSAFYSCFYGGAYTIKELNKPKSGIHKSAGELDSYYDDTVLVGECVNTIIIKRVIVIKMNN